MWVDISVHGASIQVELGLYSWTLYIHNNHDRPIRGVNVFCGGYFGGCQNTVTQWVKNNCS